PPPASTPGGDRALASGTGAIHGCETLKCWPRAPGGETTARVAWRSWERRISTRVMAKRSGSGWRDRAPSSSGSMPSGGRGGSTGHEDLSCSRKEREPERCRDVAVQEACGVTSQCSVRDL